MEGSSVITMDLVEWFRTYHGSARRRSSDVAGVYGARGAALGRNLIPLSTIVRRGTTFADSGQCHGGARCPTTKAKSFLGAGQLHFFVAIDVVPGLRRSAFGAELVLRSASASAFSFALALRQFRQLVGPRQREHHLQHICRRAARQSTGRSSAFSSRGGLGGAASASLQLSSPRPTTRHIMAAVVSGGGRRTRSNSTGRSCEEPPTTLQQPVSEPAEAPTENSIRKRAKTILYNPSDEAAKPQWDSEAPATPTPAPAATVTDRQIVVRLARTQLSQHGTGTASP